MRFTSADAFVDDALGRPGTPEREAVEARLKEEADAYFMGEAIRAERERQHLTQEQLGERIGVKRSQICKLERGRGSMTVATMGRVFRALGFHTATLDLGSGGRVALW